MYVYMFASTYKPLIKHLVWYWGEGRGGRGWPVMFLHEKKSNLDARAILQSSYIIRFVSREIEFCNQTNLSQNLVKLSQIELQLQFLPSILKYTQRNLFEILSNKTETKLYLTFSDWFGTKRASVWFQINRKMVYTIWFQFYLIRFRKDFSVCVVLFVENRSMQSGNFT